MPQLEEVEEVAAEDRSAFKSRTSSESPSSPGARQAKRNGACVLCTSRLDGEPRFGDTAECSECGNGVREEPYEQCDTESCCDPGTCQWLVDGSPCTVVANGCRLLGQCTAADGQGCAVDETVVYATHAVDDGGASVSAKKNARP